jgi:DNA-binding NarL/FixJ family response regulator
MPRILIVDDHPLVRAGFAQLIGDCPDLEVCGEAADMAEALRLIDNDCPDLAIIDLSLAGGSGLDLIEHIKSRDQDILMLVASMHDETLYAERVLTAGARGYINKQEAQDSIIRAIRQVLSGKVYLSEAMTERLLSGMVNTREQKRDIELLSNRELQVFELIGHGTTVRIIARKLEIGPKTVETHRRNIKIKLELNNGMQLNHAAFQWMHSQPD